MSQSLNIALCKNQHEWERSATLESNSEAVVVNRVCPSVARMAFDSSEDERIDGLGVRPERLAVPRLDPVRRDQRRKSRTLEPEHPSVGRHARQQDDRPRVVRPRLTRRRFGVHHARFGLSSTTARHRASTGREGRAVFVKRLEIQQEGAPMIQPRKQPVADPLIRSGVG